MTITAALDHSDVDGAAPPVAEITHLLQALADPVRLELLRALAGSDHPISCGNFQVQVTKSTLSHHLRVLREAGVIEQRCDGTRKLTSLRRRDLDERYPGLIQSLLPTPAEAVAAS
ncbi:MAG TPA: helix-turn-helix domain-containing protein [Candidatus Micrarchaeaceae archaeon]|nr:helix-turn-helix domain-containing protein [Candidatus Micrarchaeaceae archaeon]